MKPPPQDDTASTSHPGALTPQPPYLIATPRHFLGKMRKQGARSREPRRSELQGRAQRLTGRVMSHGLCQHGLPTAGWAVHEDASGRVDADLQCRGKEG